MDDVLSQFINKNSNDAREYKNIIEELLCDNYNYGYAQSILLGILDHIERSDSISDKQAQAIDNIKNNPTRHGYYRR